jgi:lipid-binding SYLF domain-containing protein
VEAGTNLTFDSPIYSYSRNKGVFAGVSLDGSILAVDDSANEKVYGKKLSGTEILLEGKVAPNDVTRPFVEALKRNTPPQATE